MANEAIIHDTTTALARARAALNQSITDLALAYMGGVVGNTNELDRAVSADVVSRRTEMLIAAAKAEGAREEAARMLAIRAESDTLAAEVR